MGDASAGRESGPPLTGQAGKRKSILIKPTLEALPVDLGNLEARWPRLLVEIMNEINSPEDPEKLIAQFREDQTFMDLIQGWDNMPTAAQANAWIMIQDRLWEKARETRLFCVRCGECCRQGSPVLFDQDRPALADGVFQRGDLITLRPGEMAFSNREQKVVVLEQERIKIREAPDGRSCIFLGPGGDACLVYSDRPYQCRILECWDPSRFQTLLKLPPLNRRDVLGADNPLAEIISRHDQRCAARDLSAALENIVDDDPASQDSALEIILYDLHVREFVGEKFGLALNDLEFFFGRPLALLCRDFGFSFDPGRKTGPKLIRVQHFEPRLPAGQPSKDKSSGG